MNGLGPALGTGLGPALGTALVTGASGAIGAAIARGLAAAGAAVGLAGRDAERLGATAEACRATGGDAWTHAADLSSSDAVADLAEAVQSRWAELDVLVHAAGHYVAAPASEVSWEDLERLLAVNLHAPLALTQALLGPLRAATGQVVAINSSAAVGARDPAVGAYAASKAALRALTDALRTELNPAGIRVLSVFPGRTASALQASIHAREGIAYDPERLVQPADIAASVLSALNLPRSAEVTDLHLRPMRP